MDAADVGGPGGTFGGNPLSCAAALAALDTIEEERLLERARRLGERFAARAHGWQRRWSIIGEIRGLGAMQAIELVKSPETREPAEEETQQLLRYCREHGLIVLSAGSYGNVIRLLAPLVIGDAEFEEGLEVLEAAFETVCQPSASGCREMTRAEGRT